jgi:hypothetical protein
VGDLAGLVRISLLIPSAHHAQWHRRAWSSFCLRGSLSFEQLGCLSGVASAGLWFNTHTEHCNAFVLKRRAGIATVRSRISLSLFVLGNHELNKPMLRLVVACGQNIFVYVLYYIFVYIIFFIFVFVNLKNREIEFTSSRNFLECLSSVYFFLQM